MVQKLIDTKNLYRDLGFIIQGNVAAGFLHMLAPPENTQHVLEMGSGSGKLAIGYALQGSQVMAIDIDPAALEYGKRLWAASLCLMTGEGKPGEIEFRKESLFDFGIKETYDLVFNEGVVNHWPDDHRRQLAINLMVDTCRPGGLVCVISNNGHLESEREIDHTVEFTYEGMPPRRRCFTQEELISKLNWAGLEDVQVIGVVGDLREAQLIAGWGRKPSIS